MRRMSIEELESEAMELKPKARARLARKLLESLESLSEEGNDRIWAEEASRRDSDLDSEQDGGRDADEVLRDATNRLRLMRRVSFHKLAEREFNDTARYYDLESPGLGPAFLDSVEKT
jgi:hypothetical protein